MDHPADIHDDELTDAQVFALTAHDRTQFVAIFDRHYDVVFGYLARRFGHFLAEELAAETFAQAFEHRSRFDMRSDSARPWLFGIAVRLAAAHHRREARRLRAYSRAAGTSTEADEVSEITSRLDAKADAARVADALARMPEADRAVIELFAWGGLGYAEIADALGIPTGTVRSRMNRARRVLVAAFEHAHNPPAALAPLLREDAA